MKKGMKSSKGSEGYSHPLIGRADQPAREDHLVVLPTYQPVICSNQHRISSKIGRCSFLPAPSPKEMLVAVHPFSTATALLPISESVREC